VSDRINARLVASRPVPAWLVELPEGEHHSLPFDEYTFLEQLELLQLDFRAVSFDRLKYVIANGVDVDPVDSVMWVDCLDKAWEYGGWPKLVMAFDPGSLEPSYREVTADTDPETIAQIQVHYPNSVARRDGKKIWCSRLSVEDNRIATSYERQYGRWIGPYGGYPLRTLLIFVRPQDMEGALAALS